MTKSFDTVKVRDPSPELEDKSPEEEPVVIATVKGLKPCRLRQVIQTDETFWNTSSIYGIKQSYTGKVYKGQGIM